MTGGGRGFCAGFATPGFANPVAGRGAGQGFGAQGGRGCRHQFYATGLPGWARANYGPAASFGPAGTMPAQPTEAEYLRRQADGLKAALGDVESRLAELEQRQPSVG